MKTIILPGYSLHNKDWAYEVRNKLNLNQKVIVHEWKHWTSGSFSVAHELRKIAEEIRGNEKINIIAKSVGTRVAMEWIIRNPKFVNKLVLCGIPVSWQPKDVGSVSEIFQKGLSFLKARQILIFQNEKDPFSTFEKIKEMVGRINRKIKVIENPRNDHHYPYFDEFQKFLGKV